MKAFEPKIVAFCCHYCALAAADVAGKTGVQIPANIRIIRVLCTGKIEVDHILKTLEAGADGVVVIGCKFGECYFREGNFRAAKKIERVQNLIEEIGLERDRVRFDFVPGPGAGKFGAILNGMKEQISSLGPSPLGRQ